MLEKSGTIKNPLTIIAIFAGITEISGTAILPFLSEKNQDIYIYIWFLIIFPLILITLFFITLNFNHKVLYAPSDFQDDENFFKTFQPASNNEIIKKIKEQSKDIENELIKETTNFKTNNKIDHNTVDKKQKDKVLFSKEPASKTKTNKEKLRNLQGRYFLTKELVLNKISKDTGITIVRNQKINTKYQQHTSFDGIMESNKKFTIIEVNYIYKPEYINNVFKSKFLQALNEIEKFTDQTKIEIKLLIAIATDTPIIDHDKIKNTILSRVGITPFEVEVQLFNIEDLEKEFIT